MNTEHLEKASEAYYNGNPILTDSEFDEAVIKLRKDDPDHPFLKRVGAPIPGKEKVKHIIKMGSLDNANNEGEFRKWIPGTRNICLSHKLDGSSVELIYQNGSFIQAITRGDGWVGEDVTKNVLRSGNVPLSIDPEIISVRCECLIHKDSWAEHFKGDANPRNSAAGTLRRHDGRNAKYLRFYAFDAEPVMKCDFSPSFVFDDNVMHTLEQWFLVPLYTLSRGVEWSIEWCQESENSRDTFLYEIDGVVAKINNRIESLKMGNRDGRPKGQIAIKFKPRGGETILKDVTWQVGRTGALTPVGEVNSVGVGGIMIERVTLCNPDEIKRLDIAIGDTVEVVRAGDVIPQLTRRVHKSSKRKPISLPRKCPECGGKTAKDGARLFCQNDECPGQSFGRVMTWIKKRNILNLGIGIVKAAGIECIEQLYWGPANERDDSFIDSWANIEVGNGVLGEKRAIKVYEALEKSMSVSLPEFLGSIGIKGIGRSLCHTLCEGLGLKVIDDVFAIKPEEIELLEGFGHARAYDFCSWILDHQEEIESLSCLMDFEDQPDAKCKGGVFNGETICFTGKSPKTRPEMTALAESAGASVSSSVNPNTTILVIADIESVSSKATKARKLKIRLISPDEFLEQMGV